MCEAPVSTRPTIGSRHPGTVISKPSQRDSDRDTTKNRVTTTNTNTTNTTNTTYTTNNTNTTNTTNTNATATTTTTTTTTTTSDTSPMHSAHVQNAMMLHWLKTGRLLVRAKET